MALVLPKTIQERIVSAVRDSYETMLDVDNLHGQGVDGPLWNLRTQGPIGGVSALGAPKITVEQGPEANSALFWPREDRVLTLYSEFVFLPIMAEGIDNFSLYRYYLGRIQNQLFGTYERKTLGGIATDVVETNNQPQIESQDDPQPGGLITFQVTYQIMQGNAFANLQETQEYG